ncbi:MAG: hypothetical protein OES57_04590 [Acidimicrobiia bacterium]|nr:hypothetical protein [Acidimicrobiia bacterium]
MSKRTIAFLVVVLTAVLAVPTAALAQTAESSSDVTLAGRGWLKARGTGTAHIEMGGFQRLRLKGDVTIVDHAGDLRVTVRGQGQDAQRAQADDAGRVVLTDFDGLVKLKGTHFEVEAGGAMVIKAKGHGVAELDGNGVFRTRRGPWRTWDGRVLQIGSGLEA